MRLRKSLENSISVLFAIVSSIILFCALFFDGETFAMHNYNMFFVIVAAIAWGVFLFFIRNRLIKVPLKLSVKKEIFVVAAILAILLVVMILISRTLAVYYSWDPNEIFWSIKEYFDSGKIGNLVYLTHYPFQLFLVVIEIAFIKSVWHFGAVMSIEGIQMLLNMIVILGTFLVTYLIMKKLLSRRQAMFGLLTEICFSPLLLYTPILYTDTTSMFFIVLGFYLFLWLIDKRVSKWWSQALLAIGFSVAELFAFELKATAGIMLIAMIIYVALKIKKEHLKRLFVCLSIFVVIFLSGTHAVKTFESSIVDLSKQTPVTHWLMMAQQNYGDYNSDDVQTTFGMIEKGEDAKSYNIETIKNRIMERGFVGNLEFIAKKISYMWGDGTYYVSAQLNKLPRTPESLMFKIFGADGEYNIVYIYVAHGLQLLMLAIFCYGAFCSIKTRGWANIVKLAIIGLFIFFLFWETTSRYLLSYIPMFVILMTYLMGIISKEMRLSVIIVEKKAKNER